MATFLIEATLMATLQGTTWMGAAEAPFNISFGENHAHGVLSCNNFRTSYSESDANLDFQGIITTRKGCGPSVMKQERLILTFLENTATFAVEGNDLLLKDTVGKTIVKLVRKT